MGKYKKGILGYFRGKVGTVVGAIWNGIHYMRSLPDVGEDNPTPAQLNVRAKMALVMGFLKRLNPLIKVGYQRFTNGVTPMNAATSYHLKNAVTGTDALNYAIDYSKVVLSAGDLVDARTTEVLIDTTGVMKFSWLNRAPATGTGGTDMATIAVYNPARKQFVTLSGAAPRSALTYNLSVPGDFSLEEVQVWIFFVSTDGKQVSDSFYVGEFLLL